MALKVKTYGNIESTTFQDRKAWKLFNCEPHVCMKFKAVFTKIGQAQVQPFIFPDSPEVCHDLLWFTERYPLAIGELDLKKLKSGKKKHIDNVNELERIMLPDHQPRPVQLNEGCEARHYQLTGSSIHLKCKRILIGDDIGLGKTLIAILALLHKGTLPAVVVVQTHLTGQWKSQIERFTNLKVFIINGTKPFSLPDADVYVIRYSCIAGWSDVLSTGKFKSATFDECQELRIETSLRYHGAQALSNAVEYCLGLSASPVYNRGSEIFNVLNLIKPGCLGTRNQFEIEYTDNYGNVRHPQALGTYLRENFLMLRRTRKEVGRELPPINKIVQTVGYDDGEVKKVEDIARMLAIKVTTGTFEERGQAAREFNMLMRQVTGVSKAMEVAEYVKMLLENGEPIVLAGWHRAVYEIWLKELAEYNPVLYTGSESTAEKEKSKNAFINGETNLFIISLRSGIGLDGLQHRSNIIVLGELDWSPKVHDQLVGRLDRDGQEEQVTAIYLVSDYGSDPPIVDLLGLKSNQIHGIVNPLTAVEEQFSDESRIKLMAQSFLEKRGHHHATVTP